MKKTILSFFAGVSLVILTAAATGITEVKPATPKAVHVQSFRAMYFLEKEMAEYIHKKTKEGYIVKSVSMMDDESWSKGIVVMEKY